MERADPKKMLFCKSMLVLSCSMQALSVSISPGSANDLTDICRVVTCMLLGCLFLMLLVINTG